MTLVSALRGASQANQAISTALQGVAENIANAQNPAYARQQVVFSSAGGGVNVAVLRRSTNRILESVYGTQIASAGQAETLNRYLQEVARLVGLQDASTPAGGGTRLVLPQAFSDFVQAWTDYQASPELEGARETLRRTSADLVSRLHDLNAGLDELETQIRSDISDSVQRVNGLVRQIATLNRAVVQRQNAGGGNTAALEAERETLVRELSTYFSLQLRYDENNSLDVFLESGASLITGTLRASLRYDPDRHELAIGGRLLARNESVEALPSGSLLAQFNLLRDGEDNTRQRAPDVALLEKIRLQLDGFAEQLLDTEEGSFNRAAQFTDLADETQDYFTRDDAAERASLAITFNELLADGTLPPPTENLNVDEADLNILTVLGRTTRSIDPSVLALPAYLEQSNVSYEGLARGIFNFVNIDVTEATDNVEIETRRRDTLRDELLNSSNVNIDEELVLLTELQNAFAANARVIAIAGALLRELIDSLG